MKRILVPAFAALLLAGCDGPQEDAGEVADNAAGAVSGEDSIRSGPAEDAGERNDEAAEAVNDAREARADAMEDEADRLEDAADRARGN